MSDTAFRIGDSVTIVVKVKPFIDVTISPSSNMYRDVTCVNIAIYDPENPEVVVESGQMKNVPNRDGYYFYRWQTVPGLKSGVYTAIATSIVSIDKELHNNRVIQEIRLLDDGLL